jgi:hypothetical protein
MEEENRLRLFLVILLSLIIGMIAILLFDEQIMRDVTRVIITLMLIGMLLGIVLLIYQIVVKAR